MTPYARFWSGVDGARVQRALQESVLDADHHRMILDFLGCCDDEPTLRGLKALLGDFKRSVDSAVAALWPLEDL